MHSVREFRWKMVYKYIYAFMFNVEIDNMINDHQDSLLELHIWVKVQKDWELVCLRMTAYTCLWMLVHS